MGVILASGVAVAASLLLLRSEALSDARRRNEALAHAIEEQTARTLQTVDLRLQIAASRLAQAVAEGPLDEKASRALLNEQLRDLPFVRAMWVMDAQGRIVQDSDVGNVGVALDDRRYFRIHRDQPQAGLYIGDPVISRSTGGWMISMSRPLAHAKARFAGVIVAALSPQWFAQRWASVGLRSSDAVALLRSDGVLLMRSPFDAAAMGHKLSGLALFRPPLSGASAGSFEQASPVDGVHRLFAFRSLATQPELRVVVGLDVDALLAPWRRIALVAGAFWMVASGVVGLLAFLLARDLARRFAIEQQMRQSVQKLNLALQGGNLGQWDWDVPSGRLSVNERWMTMLGMDPQGPAPTVDDWQARVHPQDVPKLDRLIKDVIFNPTGRDFEAEVRARHADGHDVWILDKGVVVDRAADGSPLRVAGTHLDITENKQAAQALLDSNDFNASVIDSLTTQIAVLDAHGVIIAVNAAWRRFAIDNGAPDSLDGLGIGADYLGVCVRAIDGPQGEDARKTRTGIQSVLTGELSEFHFEYPCHSPTERRWFQLTVAPMKGGGAVVSHTTITERKLAEEALLRTNRTLHVISSCNLALAQANDEPEVLDGVCRAMVEAGGYLMAWIGFAENDAAKTVRLVAQAGDVSGYLQGFVCSWDGSSLYGGGPTGAAIRHASTQVNQNWRVNPLVEPWRERALLSGFGSSIALPLTGTTRCLGALSVYAAEPGTFDAKEVEMLEELARNLSFGLGALRARAQRDRAEAASLSKSRFLVNMSHEIRTPLNAIIGLNDLLLRDAATPKQAEQIGKVADAGRHLLAIINDILDMSKIEAGQVQLESGDFHLAAVFNQVVSIIGSAARDKGLQLEVDIAAAPPWLRGDVTRLRQALLNFAGNAVKFTHQGNVTLRARLLDEADGELLLHFSVQDTGIGIAADQLPRLFQDFEQADSSITRQYGGTGLGLAITQRLAKLMGGEAGADSTSGVGSTFWFTARLRRGLGVEPGAESTSTDAVTQTDIDVQTLLRQRHGQARILVVEDNAVNRELALAWLEAAGLSAETADDGREAVQRAQAVAYDLILMDMQMPVMDGLAATRAIRALPGGSAMPILAMTANAFSAERDLCLAAGMNDFVIKPVDVSALYASLLKWLED